MVINVFNRGWQYISLITVLVVSLVSVGGYYAYHYVSSSREKYAYKAFSESHDFFETVLTTDDGTDKEKSMKLWKDVELAFQTGYAQNKKSSLAPYFLAFQAESLIHQGDLNRAIEVMDQMMNSLKKESQLFGLYAVKRALMKLDLPENETNKKGLEELISLANEEVNPNRDMALYYLGEYYWAHNEPEKAHVAWRYLGNVAHFGKTPTPSPWFDLVKARVDGIA